MPSRLENLIDACRLGGCWRRRIGIDELGESEDHCIDMFRESRQAHGPVSKPRPVPPLTRSVIWCCRYPPFPWKAVRAASSPAEAGYTSGDSCGRGPNPFAARCTVADDKEYCSQRCEDAKGEMEISCDCAHPSCSLSESQST